MVFFPTFENQIKHKKLLKNYLSNSIQKQQRSLLGYLCSLFKDGCSLKGAQGAFVANGGGGTFFKGCKKQLKHASFGS